MQLFFTKTYTICLCPHFTAKLGEAYQHTILALAHWPWLSLQGRLLYRGLAMEL